jgi:hypothetical protein
MIKYLFAVVFALSFAAISQASVLPLNVNDLTTGDYIVYNYNGVDYDIAWASRINSQRYYYLGADGELSINELYAPTIYSGWKFAGTEGLPELTDIFSSENEILSLFKVDDSYIHAFEYWNTAFLTVNTSINNVGGITGEEDLISKTISSAWGWNNTTKPFAQMSDMEKADEAYLIMNAEGLYADTFYIRLSDITSQVPEPSTILIFAIALFALARRRKLFN